MRKVIGLWLVFIIGFAGKSVDGFDHFGSTELPFEPLSRPIASVTSDALMVGLTLIEGAAAKGAVCLDGSLPGYHLDRGHGSGANRWLVFLEGGAWCNTTKSCVARKMTKLGSSTYMEKEIQFTGILSNKIDENPDFYNWNRIKVRYCDGASFAGEGEDKEAQLQFRGQRIWLAAMEELMSKGMRNANQALLSGCSAGGLASILHCDQFRYLFPRNTIVKCLSDAGLFMDAVDVSGERYLRNMFNGVVNLQRVRNNLPRTCTRRLDPTSIYKKIKKICFTPLLILKLTSTFCDHSSCTVFFPANLIARIRTPLFIANSAFDTWQIQESLTPPSADPHGDWSYCRMNYTFCSTSQIQFLLGFRNQMLDAVKGFSKYKRNGLYLNSCFAHCQAHRGDIWFAADAPLISNKPLAVAVGDWYFDRAAARAIDYPYPKTCEPPHFSSNLFSRFASF